MPGITPAQQDFVADYAAKRQAQMERAKAIKDQRDAARGSQQPLAAPRVLASGGAGPTLARDPNAAQHHPRAAVQVTSYGFGAVAPVSQPDPFAEAGQVQRGVVASGFAAPPPLAPVGAPAQRGPFHAPLPAQQPAPAVSTAAAMAAAPRDCVTVTQDDFRRAVSRGIISQDQCRQLWCVLSADATATSGSADGVVKSIGNAAAGASEYIVRSEQ